MRLGLVVASVGVYFLMSAMSPVSATMVVIFSRDEMSEVAARFVGDEVIVAGEREPGMKVKELVEATKRMQRTKVAKCI